MCKWGGGLGLVILVFVLFYDLLDGNYVYYMLDFLYIVIVGIDLLDMVWWMGLGLVYLYLCDGSGLFVDEYLVFGCGI